MVSYFILGFIISIFLFILEFEDVRDEDASVVILAFLLTVLVWPLAVVWTVFYYIKKWMKK